MAKDENVVELWKNSRRSNESNFPWIFDEIEDCELPKDHHITLLDSELHKVDSE